MQTVLIAGGTGLIGKAVATQLVAKGYTIIILTRNTNLIAQSNVRYAFWNVEEDIIDESALAKADYLINLAGASIGKKRWSKKRKQEIIESRVQSATLIYNTLRKINHKIKAVTNASAIGWYGADPAVPNQRPFIETDPHAADFLGNTCYKWEQAIQPVTTLGIRLVILRTGIVLSRKDSVLQKFQTPLKAGLATVLGSGRQVMSWIHLHDLAHLYVESLGNERYQGVYNATAPEPVSIRHFVASLAKISKGKYYSTWNIPPVALQIILGEMATEVLKSTTVSSDKILRNGFQFLYPQIESALRNLLSE